MALIIPLDIKTIDQIDTSECTHPAGHCFGNDGGSGIPNNQKVSEGQGGEQEVWVLDAAKTKIIKKEMYLRCQYCQKYTYEKDI